jgi:uncharacterized MAPEG superfamily protein
MNTDLTMLTASAVLTALLFVPYASYMWTHWSLGAVLGNRADTPPFPAWAERARRAQANMLENFPHFVALVVVANMAGLANDTTALGATIFFWARLAHAIIYITGVWQLRALAFIAGLAGEALILWQIVEGAHLLG